MSQQQQHQSSQIVQEFQQVDQQQSAHFEQQSSQQIEQQTGQWEQQNEWVKTAQYKQGCAAGDDAAALRKAMKGAGTNEQVIIDIITQRTCTERQEILKCYNSEFDRDLIADLKEELGGHFEDVIVALMTCQHEYLARELHKGIKNHKWCTVVEILCPRPAHELKKITNAYSEIFDISVTDHLTAESKPDLHDLLILMSRGLRSTSIDPDKARQNAVHLYEAHTARVQQETTKKSASAPVVEAKKELNLVLLIQILTHDSYGQCQLTFREFKNINGHYIDEVVQNEVPSGDLQKALLCSIDCVMDIQRFFAHRLNKAFEGLGTDDTTLIRVVVSRFELDLADVADAYEKEYGKSLAKAVQSETSGDYRKALLAMINGFTRIFAKQALKSGGK